jgi:hypothetical protein
VSGVTLSGVEGSPQTTEGNLSSGNEIATVRHAPSAHSFTSR